MQRQSGEAGEAFRVRCLPAPEQAGADPVQTEDAEQFVPALQPNADRTGALPFQLLAQPGSAADPARRRLVHRAKDLRCKVSHLP